MSKKIGRNSLCPCGSGKKYKNCCANLAEIIEFNTDPWIKSNQIMTTLKVKLEDHFRKDTKKIRRDAMQNFERYLTEEKIGPDHEALFSDWLWFDLPLQEKTMGEKYLDKQHTFLAPIMKECLQALNSSYLSVYRVIENRDNLIKIKDLFSGEDLDVLLKEPWETPNLLNLLLLGRVVKIMDNNIFSGMVLVMNADSGQEEAITSHVKHWHRLTNKDYKALFKAHGEILLGIFDHAFHKNLFNLLELYCIYLKESEAEALKAGLESDSDYIYAYHTEGFDWYKPLKSKGGYARMAVNENLALCTAEILDDRKAAAAILVRYLGNRDIRLIHSKFVPEMLVADEAQYWFLVLKDQETERWLLTPNKELDDKVPEQIMMEPGGKEKLLNILDEYIELAQDFEELSDLMNYMKLRVEQI